MLLIHLVQNIVFCCMANTVCFVCNRPLKEEKPTATQQKVLSLLENLCVLHQQGILTDEEFEEKKKQILSRI